MTSNPAMSEDALIDPVEVLRAVYEVGYQLESPMPSTAVIGEFIPVLLDCADDGLYSCRMDYHTGGRTVSIKVLVEVNHGD